MSDWVRPKFAYDPGTGLVDFSPTYPAIKKPGAGIATPSLSAVRADSIASSGEKQSVLERVDALLPLPFDDVPESDLTSWSSFMTYALGGGQFTYYPDASNPAVYQDYTLEDTDWRPVWKSWKNYSFTILLRQFVGTPTYYS